MPFLTDELMNYERFHPVTTKSVYFTEIHNEDLTAVSAICATEEPSPSYLNPTYILENEPATATPWKGTSLDELQLRTALSSETSLSTISVESLQLENDKLQDISEQLLQQYDQVIQEITSQNTNEPQAKLPRKGKSEEQGEV